MNRLPRVCFDLLLVLLGTVVAILLRTDLELPSPDLVRYIPYMIATASVALLSIGALKLDVGYWRHASMRDILSVIAVAGLTAFGSTAIIFAVNRLEGIARTIPLLQFVFIIVFLLAPRFVARLSAGAGRRREHFKVPEEGQGVTRNVLIVGFNAMSDLYVRSLAEVGDRTLRVVGFVSLKPREAGRYVGQIPILGVAEDLSRVVSDLAVHGVTLDRVVLAISPRDLSAQAHQSLLAVERDYALTIDILAERIAGHDTGATDAPIPADLSCERVEALIAPQFDKTELETLARSSYWRAKRCLDFLGALILIAVLLPVGVIATALAIIDVGLPTVFWQVRIGMGGSSFKVFKLRTMSTAYDPHGVRIADSERVSLIGTLLRRMRLDELPQLWNVLVGDMSLIGPRPLLAADQPKFESGRLLVRPGVTGWAQVCGGRDISPESKASLDVWYIRNASFALDVRIVAATLRMLMFGERVEPTKINHAREDFERATSLTSAGAFQSIPAMATES